MKLRVGAYLPDEKLALEYYGEQRSKPNKFIDGREASRAEQGRRYTELRQELILKRDLKLLGIKYDKPLTREHLKSVF
jgi:hypothetical protein